MSAMWSLSDEKRTLSTSDDDSRRSNDPPSRSEMLELSSGADRLPTWPPTWLIVDKLLAGEPGVRAFLLS